MDRNQLRLIHEKTKGHCWYCGIVLHPLGDWQVEHQTPKAKQGSDEIDNLVPACRACNVRKGNRTVEEYRRSLNIKLESKLGEASEFCQDFEGYVDWPQGEPPDALSAITDHLLVAHEISSRVKITFYGERESLLELTVPIHVAEMPA